MNWFFCIAIPTYQIISHIDSEQMQRYFFLSIRFICRYLFTYLLHAVLMLWIWSECRQLFGFLYIKLNSRFIRFDCWSWNFPAEQGKTELIDIAKRSLKLNIYDFQWSWKSTNYYSAKLSLIHVKNMAFSSFHPCRLCVSERWRHTHPSRRSTNRFNLWN